MGKKATLDKQVEEARAVLNDLEKKQARVRRVRAKRAKKVTSHRAMLSVDQMTELGDHLHRLDHDSSVHGLDHTAPSDNFIEVTSDGCVGVNGAWLRPDGEWSTA